MKWLLESFGKWECVVTKVLGDFLIVCHKHSVSKRVKGYVCMPGGVIRQIEDKVAYEHYQNYGVKDESV